MGGVPLDEEAWKAILEESDNNKDGKVYKYFSFFSFFF